MGLFDKNFEKSASELYQDIKNYLKPKDGKKHIVLINTTTKMTTNGLECENKYTLQIDGIIEEMQKNNYEIIEVKIDSSQQIVANMNLIRTLIMYQ